MFSSISTAAIHNQNKYSLIKVCISNDIDLMMGGVQKKFPDVHITYSTNNEQCLA
jgi:hypothetical protein